MSKKEKNPDHYKVVTFSLYSEDIQLLEELVTKLRLLGNTRANKSMVVRAALQQLDVNKMPKVC